MKKALLCVAILAMMAGSAYAADWNFYGSARVETFYTDTDNGDGTSTKNFSESLQGNARIGARVKVSDELTGRFEYGASDGNANIRLLYGNWNFGPGQLRIGQDYTPLYLPVSNQVYATDNGLAGWGEPYPGRHAQIKLIFGGFQFAMVSPDNTYYDGTDAVDTNTEVRIPRLEVRYKVNIDNWYVAAGAGYNSFEVSDQYDVDSYIGVVNAGFKAGSFSLGGEAFVGENIGNIVSSDVNGNDSGKGYAQVSGGTVQDNEAYGYEIVAAYMINEMLSLEAGLGYARTELDNADKDDMYAYYLQAPITLAPGVFVIPEVGKVDYREDAQGDKTYFGAKWQINF
ncbi:MAG: porin [Desulfobacterales bacterium]|nr:porin [Desulfobacterales bacterium]